MLFVDFNLFGRHFRRPTIREEELIGFLRLHLRRYLPPDLIEDFLGPLEICFLDATHISPPDDGRIVAGRPGRSWSGSWICPNLIQVCSGRGLWRETIIKILGHEIRHALGSYLGTDPEDDWLRPYQKRVAEVAARRFAESFLKAFKTWHGKRRKRARRKRRGMAGRSHR